MKFPCKQKDKKKKKNEYNLFSNVQSYMLQFKESEKDMLTVY